MERGAAARVLGRWQLVAAACLVLAVALPGVTGDDSFPLSTYPMYASDRDRVDTFATAAAFDGAGHPVRLSIEHIAATDDPLIAQSRVASAIDGGRAEEMCRTIADRAPADARRIEIVREEHDVVRFARGHDSLLNRHVSASCEVAA